LVRAVLGWSQTELAQRIGLTQSAIHKLEQGETEPAAQNCDRTRRNMASAKD
jgi:ribosome-binding protein aMBF1 (putative translation factor)